MTIKQIKINYDNFSYLIYCNSKKVAAIVDPGMNADEALKFLSLNNLKLSYIINTHHHWDHTIQNKRVKDETAAKIISSEIDGKKLDITPDIYINDEDHLKVGEIDLEFLLTPGHTKGSICIIVDHFAIITGDTLFIGDCGRTDLINGDIKKMYKTLHEKIMSLPDHLIVYPGHDYGDKPFDTLGNQKRTNKTLIAKNFKDFSKIP